MSANPHSGTSLVEAPVQEMPRGALPKFHFEHMELNKEVVVLVECDKFFDSRFASDTTQSVSVHEREESRHTTQSKNTPEQDALIRQLRLIQPPPQKIVGLLAPKKEKSQLLLMWPFDPEVHIPWLEVGEEIIKAIVLMPYFAGNRPVSALMTFQGLRRDCTVLEQPVPLPRFPVSQ